MRDVDRLVRVMDAFAAAQGDDVAQRLCAVAAQLLDTPGVAVAVATEGPDLLTLCRTADCESLDRLQSDLGEGPAWAAHRGGWPVIVPDLGRDARWSAFGPAAAELGLRAVFAFPLRRGSAKVGALTLYRREVGQLTDDEHADAVAVARVAVDVALSSQAGRPVDELDEMFHAGTRDGASIHQASGMVSVQLGIAVAAAMSVLRAHAFASGRTLHDVAADVIARRLRLDGPLDEPPGG